MIVRLQVDRWMSDRCFELVHPTGARKSVTTYLPSMDFDAAIWVANKAEELGLKGSPDLITLASCVGAYARLWVGDLDGIIAPMDRAPEGWSYPNHEPIESAWFWQWIPTAQSEKILLHEMEDADPLTSEPSRFKSLVPFQLQRKHGAIAQVTGIDLIRLPDLVRPGVPFLFEAEV